MLVNKFSAIIIIIIIIIINFTLSARLHLKNLWLAKNSLCIMTCNNNKYTTKLPKTDYWFFYLYIWKVAPRGVKGALLGTQEIRFGQKTNEIAKFSILDKKTKFTILDEIWTKNGQLIAEPNAIGDRGTSKRPPCPEHNLHVGGIFLWGAILAQPCRLSLQHACAVHATCWLHHTKIVQTVKAL